MKAVIYAAGRGKRLGPAHENSHKILLRFGGRTLLERHAENLAACGIKELVVVTGYLRSQVEEELSRVASRYGLTARTCHNPDYEEGSVISFHASLPEIEYEKEPVLLMDGDVLYPAQMLRRLIESPHPTCLLIDREYSTADDDPVLVPIRNNRPDDFRKRWQGKADAVGESVGFFKISPRDLPMIAEQTRRRVETGRGRDEPYEEVLRELVVDGRFGHEDVTSLPWTEIDFPGDIERAEREILPAIEYL